MRTKAEQLTPSPSIGFEYQIIQIGKKAAANRTEYPPMST